MGICVKVSPVCLCLDISWIQSLTEDKCWDVRNERRKIIIVFVSTGIHPSLNLYSIICEPSSCNVETLTMERFLLSSISNRYHSSCACLNRVIQGKYEWRWRKERGADTRLSHHKNVETRMGIAPRCFKHIQKVITNIYKKWKRFPRFKPLPVCWSTSGQLSFTSS